MEIEKKGIIEKIINVVLNILIFIFGIILLISIYNNMQVKLFGKDYSDFFGYSIFEVQTGSMMPAIGAGDWIIVKSSNYIETKDIITFKQGEEYITHRVISKHNDTYVTRGDANNTKDEPIDKKQIVGKVVKILPNFGIFKKTIFNPYVLIAIITTIMVCNFVFKKPKKEISKKVENPVIDKLTKISNDLAKSLKENKIKLKDMTLKKEKKSDVIVQSKEEELEFDEELPSLEEESFSYIPVDASELDETFLEIAQNEIQEQEIKVEKTKEIEEVEEELEEERPTKLNLELLEKGKKSKNIIEKAISVKVEELNEIISVLDDGKINVNEPTIKNRLMSSYIDARYYNYYGNVDVSTNKKQTLKIEKYIESVAELLKKKYSGSDTKFSVKVDKYLNIFKTITHLEQAKDSITDKKAKEEFYKKELSKYSKECDWNSVKIKSSISEIMKIQRNYVGIVDYLFKKIETNMFSLELSKLKADKNMYASSLEHNITFGKIYSDYIIDKTYNEGIIAENKLIVLLNLLSIKIIRDMLDANFNKKYIVYFSDTLYSKEKKLEKILKMIEDEHAKESVIILIKSECLFRYKTLIKKLKKEGYKFATVLVDDSKIEQRNILTLSSIDYIFVDKNIPNLVQTLSTLPEDVTDKLVYENIIQKIGDFGGEE